MQERRRKDQWTQEDDEQLAEIVIQSVKDGKTQLEAFQIAAEKLGRTKQACGFRWNKTLRNQYGQVLLHVKKRPKQVIQSHLKLALTSYEQLAENYQQLELKYKELQYEHDRLIKWLQQGFAHLSKD